MGEKQFPIGTTNCKLTSESTPDGPNLHCSPQFTCQERRKVPPPSSVPNCGQPTAQCPACLCSTPTASTSQSSQLSRFRSPARYRSQPKSSTPPLQPELANDYRRPASRGGAFQKSSSDPLSLFLSSDVRSETGACKNSQFGHDRARKQRQYILSHTQKFVLVAISIGFRACLHYDRKEVEWTA